MSQLYTLQKGDIIRLEKGIDIYALIPEKFSRCSSAPFSSKLIEMPIQIGEILHKNLFFHENKENLIKWVEEKIQSVIKSEVVTTEKVASFIDSLGLNFSPEEFDTSIFIGDYRIYDTTPSSGLCNHADIPEHVRKRNDSLHIYCEKVDNPDIRIHFFQKLDFSGQFPFNFTSSDC